MLLLIMTSWLLKHKRKAWVEVDEPGTDVQDENLEMLVADVLKKDMCEKMECILRVYI